MYKRCRNTSFFDIMRLGWKIMYFLEDLKKQEKTWGRLTRICYSKRSSFRDDEEIVFLFEEGKIIRHCYGLEVQKEYSLIPKDVSKIEAMIEEYHFPAWKSLKKNEHLFPVSDKEIAFIYEKDGEEERYQFFYTSSMENAARRVLKEFLTYLESVLREENLLKEEKETMNSTIGYMGMLHHIPDAGEGKREFCPECGLQMKGTICECGYQKDQ